MSLIISEDQTSLILLSPNIQNQLLILNPTTCETLFSAALALIHQVRY